jgi:outer membrane protein assembly factor BamB
MQNDLMKCLCRIGRAVPRVFLTPGLRYHALLLAAVLSIVSTLASDWPSWRGPARNGISAEAGLNLSWTAEGPKVLWKGSIGKGFSSVTVAKGRVYSMGNLEEVDTVYCLDAETGKGIWKHSYPSALDPKAFEGGPLSTPVVDEDRLYTMGKFGQFFCLDASTGAVKWTNKFEPPALTKADYHVWWGFAGSPLITGDRVILPVGTAGVAMDKLTGKEIWNNGPGHSGYSTPVLFNSDAVSCFAFVSGHQVVAAQVSNGEIRWTLPWKTTWDQNASDVIVSAGKIFVSTGHGVGCALFDFTSGKPVQVWRNKNLRTYLSSCILWKGFLYGFDDRQLNCVDWNTGEVKWSAPDLGLGGLILADGKLIALTEKGTLLVAEASSEAYRPLAEAQILGGRCWSAPSLSDGRLYVRNAIGDLVCLDLGSKGAAQK